VAVTPTRMGMFVAQGGANLFFVFCLLSSLFLLWGFCNGMIDIMDKHFQDELHLSLVSRRTLFDGGLSTVFDVVPGSGSRVLKSDWEPGTAKQESAAVKPWCWLGGTLRVSVRDGRYE
jgi:hypothetical protein